MTVYWLLDLDVDGHMYRLADIDLDVTRDDGSVLHYTGALTVEPVTESLSVLSASVTQPEAQVRIWLDDVSTLAILRGRGELSRWVDGTTYERRRRVLAGKCQSPESESADQGISTTIAQDAWLDPERLIPSSQTATTSTWATLSTVTDAKQAYPYPIIIGHPGRTPGAPVPALVTIRIDATAGQPAAIGANWDGIAFQLAGHHISATRALLTTETDSTGITAHVINTFDDNGQAVAVCPWFLTSTASPAVLAYNGAEAYTFSGGGEYGVGEGSVIAPAYNIDTAQPAVYASLVDDTTPSSGGLQVNGALLRAAGDVLAWALSRSGAAVDRLRMTEAARVLSVYQIDAVIAENCSPWDWVTQVLLPILPCSLASGPDGLFVVPFLLDATEADAEARLDTRRPDVARVGARKWDTSQLVRSVTLNYCYDVQSGKYTHLVCYASTTAATADVLDETRSHPTLDLAAAWGLTGEDLVVNTAAMYDKSSAALACSTIARIRGLPTSTLVFDVPEDDEQFFRLRRGSIVYGYDADTDTDTVGQVIEIGTPGNGSLLITAWFILDPIRGSLS